MEGRCERQDAHLPNKYASPALKATQVQLPTLLGASMGYLGDPKQAIWGMSAWRIRLWLDFPLKLKSVDHLYYRH